MAPGSSVAGDFHTAFFLFGCAQELVTGFRQAYAGVLDLHKRTLFRVCETY